MGYDALRKQYDPTGALNGVPDEAFLTYVADHDGKPGTMSLPTTPAGVYNAATKAVTKVAGAAAGMVKSAATDLSNIPRGLVADPLAQVFQNRSATPEEETRSFSGLAGLTGLLTAPGITEAAGMGMAKLGGPKLLQKILAGAGSGALLGGGDAAIRSGGHAKAIPYGMASGTVAGGAFGAMLPGYRAPIGPVAAPLTDTASQEWHAGLENDALHPGMKIGGGLSPANKARVTKNAGALESLYGGAQEAAQEAPPKGLGFQKQRALEGLYGRGKPPRVLRVPFETTASADLPMNLKSQVARSPLGPVVSSVTDRMRAMGPVGQAMDDMIEQVARQSQEEPGNHLQPFDEALHAVTGRKGKLPPEARRSLLAAFQGRLDPQKLAPNLQPLYQQAKDYFKGTVQRGTNLGATVQRGDKRVPLAQAQIEHYFPQRAVTVDALKGDSDLRAAIAHNLEDQGLAKTPQEAQAILDDHIAFAQSKGKRGGQLAIGAMKGLNPEMTPAQLKNALLYSKPPLRMPGGSLEFSRTVNSPFYDPRPETVFPQHVVDTERALAEIEHYGQDASKLTGKMLELPSEHQQEMQHLVRTATESHAPWDPRLTGFLGKLRTAQLGLFTPQTSVKNLSQRANNLLTSDVTSFAKRGMLAGKGAAKIGARSGARAEGAHETLAQALGTKSGAGERWLKLIGFTQAERGNRNTGAATGLDEAQKYAARLGKNPNDKLAAYRLSREGIPPHGTLPPEQVNHPVGALRIPARTDASGTLYHGSGTLGLNPGNLDATSTKPEGLFGQGVYLTDNPDVAMGYARARAKRTGTPTLYKAKVGEHRTLDLETPAPPEAVQAYAKTAKGWPFSEHGSPEFDAALAKPGVTGQELHTALAHDATNISREEGIPSGEFYDVFGNLSDNLRSAGYESLSHTGGLRVGKVQHKVTILLDPNDAGGLGRKPPIQSFEAGEAPRPERTMTIRQMMTQGGERVGPRGPLTQQEENRAALARSNKAQFRSHPKDLPDWFTSNPVMRTAALFKGFDYQQTRLMLDETLGRIASHAPGDKARGLRNLGIVASVYPVIGEGVNDIYGVISRKESPAHVAQRTKEFIHDTGQVVSGGMNPVDYAAKYKARYGADLLAGSAPGAGGVLATTLQYGKGDKGGGLVKQAVGPAISRPAEAVQLAHDALTQKKKNGEDKPMTPAQRREALRLILGGAGSTAGPWLYPDTHSAGNHAQ